jgi:hypothetical protein
MFPTSLTILSILSILSESLLLDMIDKMNKILPD